MSKPVYGYYEALDGSQYGCRLLPEQLKNGNIRVQPMKQQGGGGKLAYDIGKPVEIHPERFYRCDELAPVPQD